MRHHSFSLPSLASLTATRLEHLSRFICAYKRENQFHALLRILLGIVTDNAGSKLHESRSKFRFSSILQHSHCDDTQQIEFKNHFIQVVSPTYVDLSKRIINIVKWMPKERKALAKKLRAAQLWKLQLERVGECGISTSPYTQRIQAECSRVDEWDKKFHWAMENHAGPQHFKALLKEATEGEQPVLVDVKDTKLCESFTELYCLCQSHYQDGVFGLVKSR